jgi:hypothetical protein
LFVLDLYDQRRTPAMTGLPLDMTVRRFLEVHHLGALVGGLGTALEGR